MKIWSRFFLTLCYWFLFLHDVHSLRSTVKRERRSFSRINGAISQINSEVRLRSAVITGDITTVRWCIDVEGTDMNCVGSRGTTPLHWASEKFDIVQFLLARGANMEAKDDELYTPLMSSNCHLDRWNLVGTWSQCHSSSLRLFNGGGKTSTPLSVSYTHLTLPTKRIV